MKFDLKYMTWLTPGRLRIYAVIWALLSLVILAIELYRRTSLGLYNEAGMVFGVDFVPFWGGGHLAGKGALQTAYDFEAFHAFHSELLGTDQFGYKFDYPPIAALFLIPFGLLPYVPGFFVWTLAGLVSLTAGLKTVFSSWRMSLLVALATPATFLTMVLGQNAGFTAGLMGGGLTTLERRPVLAGVLIGLLAFKPQLAVLVPFAFIAAGAWRSFAAATVTVVVLTGVSLLAFGVSGWEAFLEHSRINSQLMLGEEMYVWPHMTSIFISARTVGLGSEAAYGLQIATALIAAVVTVLVWRREIPLPVKASVLVVASFFVTPYLHVYDLTVLAFVIGWRAAVSETHPFLPWEKLVLAVAMILPLVSAQIVQATGIPVAPLVLGALVVLQVRVALGRAAALVPA